jgi:hypothetical protein
MSLLRAGSFGFVLFVFSISVAGCARPATTEPAPPVVLAPELPVAAPADPHLAPAPRPMRHSRFFSKLSPATLDNLALQSAPKEPQWKWHSVFSGMRFSSEPGEVNFIEAGRYLASTPAGIERFLPVLKGELEERVRNSGATINDKTGAKPAAPANGFLFAYVDGNASGTIRVTITREERDDFYKLVVRVEDVMAVSAP